MTRPTDLTRIMRGPRLVQLIEDGGDSFALVVPLHFIPVRYVQFHSSTPATTVVGEARHA